MRSPVYIAAPAVMTAFRHCAGTVLCEYRDTQGRQRFRLLTDAEARRCWETTVDGEISARAAGDTPLANRLSAITDLIALAQADAQRWRKASGPVSIPTNQGRG